MRALRTYPYNVGRINQSDQFESKNSFVSKQNSQQKTMILYATDQQSYIIMELSQHFAI